MSNNSIYCSCIIYKKEFSSKGINQHYIGSHTKEGNEKKRLAGLKTVEKTRELAEIHNRNVRMKYADNPSYCRECGCCMPYKQRHNSFCSHTCSASYTNRERIRNGYVMSDNAKLAISIKSLSSNKRKKGNKELNVVNRNSKKSINNSAFFLCSKLYTCKACGKYHSSNENRKHCSCGLSRKSAIFKSLEKYFGLSLSNLGSLKFIEEFNKCKSYIEKLYQTNSLISLATLIGHPDPGNLRKILKSININLDNHSISQIKSLKQGRTTLPQIPSIYYKQGWYTTVNGYHYFYRSSYELRFIELLDSNNIPFVMEQPFHYYDSQLNKDRVAMPDFIIDKKIVEIKSNYTFDELNMKDKFIAYTKAGYEPILQLEFKYYKLVNNEFILQENYDPLE